MQGAAEAAGERQAAGERHAAHNQRIADELRGALGVGYATSWRTLLAALRSGSPREDSA